MRYLAQPLLLQKVKEVGGTYLCGVNYCAMDKYPGPATAAGLKNCTSSLKVGALSCMAAWGGGPVGGKAREGGQGRVQAALKSCEG